MRFFTKTFLLVLFVAFTGSCFAQDKDHLYDLYKAKQFNELNVHNSDAKHSLHYFYKAVYANVCNKPALSNTYLDELMKKKTDPPQQIGFDYWTLRNDNYVKLFDYRNAWITSEKLLKEYKNDYDTADYAGEQNAVKIWKSLAEEKVQTLSRSGTVRMPLTHDMAGLINIKVSANDLDTNFVFDTGAGISSITESLAQKLGFKILPDTGIKVSGFSGIYNPVRIAVAEELKIGNITVRNEPFLVFQDEALSFAGGAYKINGIIGFPIAKEMGTITITKDHLQVEDIQSDNTREKNLFVQLLRPVIFLKYKGKALPFNFDTGAASTQFSKAFYDEYGKELDVIGTLQNKADASAGGSRKYKALLVDSLHFHLGSQPIHFSKVDIDTENYHTSGKELYGNIGQDLLKQYQKVTISFKENYLKLEN